MKRSIPVAIILSLVTFGIYAIYWWSKINKAANTLNPNEWDKGFLTVFLLSIITFGIYGLYWNYKMGKVFEPKTGTDNSVIYIVLSLFGLSIVSIAIMQSQLNALPDVE